jgi:hypothetical protein
MTFQEIEQKIKNALLRFYKEDSYLIDNNVHERSLTFRLGMYLQNEFPDYNVDCEYNKVGNGDPKRIDLLMKAQQDCPQDCNKCAANKCVVFPDIIVHKRGREENILVIEAKTAWSTQSKNNDYKKLKALIDSGEYHYQLGVAFRFSGNFEETIKTFKLFFGEKSK